MMKPIETLLRQLNQLDIQLWLEEGHLRYNAPKGKLTATLKEEITRSKDDIIHFLEQMVNTQCPKEVPIPKVSHQELLPLSFGQQRLWFLDQLEKGQSATYNMHPMVVQLSGHLNVAALENSFRDICQRHDSLRTTFQIQADHPVQVINPQIDLPLPIIPLEGFTPILQQEEIQRLTRLQAEHLFDLTKGPLLRIQLAKLGPTEHVLFLTMHHIISDGWSLGILARELSTLYQAYSQDLTDFQNLSSLRSPLPPLPIQYADFAVWQRHRLSGHFLETLTSYWKQQLDGIPALLELPTDYPRRPVQRYRGKAEYLYLSQDLTRSLHQLSQQSGVSLFMTLLTTFAILLFRYTGQLDIVIGAPIANRTHTQLEPLIGFFLNTLVLRVNFADSPRFSELLQRVKHVCLEAYAHQELPFEKLVEELQPERNLSHTPLFQVMLVLQNTPMEEIKLANLTSTPLPTENIDAVVDLLFDVEETPKGLECKFRYNTDLFEETTIKRLGGHFRTLVEGILTHPEQSIHTLPLLTPAELAQLWAWNQTHIDYPKDQTIVDLFQTQVAKTPENIAVVFEQQQLTYQQLNTKANQLAHYLMTLGVTAETLVGIAVERSFSMIIGLLGILKAGGAYVPLDPAYPTERLQFMLEDSQVPVLLTQSHLLNQLPESKATVVLLDQDGERIATYSEANPLSTLHSPLSPKNLAYVLFTSGSTGRPKGVMIEHHSTATLIHWALDTFSASELTTVLASTSINFDLSVYEMFVPLCQGGKVVIIENALSLPTLAPEYEITLINTVPSALAELWRLQGIPKSVQVVNLAGEPLRNDLVQTLYQQETIKRIYNLYGPSEDTTYSTYSLIVKGSRSEPTIGRPIANTQVHILDANHQLTPPGMAGELCIAGAGLARGYLNRSALTAEKFVELELFGKRTRIYKTGDLARWLPEGNLEYLGRFDHQVKLRGFRIELSEIEITLTQHEAVKEAVVILRDQETSPNLAAYITLTTPIADNVAKRLRTWLSTRLPNYMIPASITVLEKLPLNPNGKIDRQVLPSPEFMTLTDCYEAPQTDLEHQLVKVWREVLKLDQVGIHNNFFDVGGHSLLLMQVQSHLQALLGKTLPVVKLFQYPTIHSLATHLAEAGTTPKNWIAEVKPNMTEDSREIAIIGMAGRFPGANNIETFWKNLREGVESIQFFSDEELLKNGVSPTLLNHPKYVKAGGVLDGADLFDASFFGYAPAEADILDPQQRLFLEIAWAGLEHAGYDVERLNCPVGVFAGVSMNTYLLNNLLPNRTLLDAAGNYQLLLGGDKDYLATRTAYKLNLTGPALTIQTACSTSLVATHVAIQSLIQDECEMALVGGVSVAFPQHQGYLYQDGMIASPDGHCRAFSATAQGTVGGDGVGVVVLKRLSRALADGDTIHAVIKGSAINNDGRNKVGFTAPSVDGQTAVIAAAMRGLDYESISYIETHGTGTVLGDPIEISALTQAYRSQTQKIGYCALGAVKTNVGHLDAAAGITGLIKTVLALKHREIPPTLHFEKPNPQIAFAESPFFVNTQLRPWQSPTPRRAGVSSFGMGGTNAHLVLEEAPSQPPLGSSRPWQLLLLSAKTSSALETMTKNLVIHLESNSSELALADIAYTLAVGRRPFPHRRIVFCQTLEQAKKALQSNSPQSVFTQSTLEGKPRPVIFMFPGLGSEYPKMTAELYREAPLFQEQIDKCAELLKPHLNWDVRDVLGMREGQSYALDSSTAPVTLFVVEYALAQLWMSYGIQPHAMLGYSQGEYVAACLAGVVSLEEALAMMAYATTLLPQLTEGRMLSILQPESVVRSWLGPELSLAAVNDVSLCIVSGTPPAIQKLQERLLSQQVQCYLTTAMKPLHSYLMAPLMAPLLNKIQTLSLHPPKIPWLSSITGTWVTPQQATDPRYYTQVISQTLRFNDTIQKLFQEEKEAILLEVGPGQVLSPLILQHPDRPPEQQVLSTLKPPQYGQPELASVLTTLGRLWVAGVEVNWTAFYANEQRRRVPLPTYPFERQRYWIEPVAQSYALDSKVAVLKKNDIEEWFYVPSWRRLPISKSEDLDSSASWLVFLEATDDLTASLAERLIQAGQEVVTVQAGDRFAQLGPQRYVLNPSQSGDYQTLLTTLHSVGNVPSQIVHSWLLTKNLTGLPDLSGLMAKGFYSVLYLCQALAKPVWTTPLTLTIIANHLQEVTGAEFLNPDKSPVLGLLKVIPQEYPHLTCRSLDVEEPTTKPDKERLVKQLLWELQTVSTRRTIAYRKTHRWVQTFEPIHLPETMQTSPFRKGGVYLITGGLGKIGLLIAEYLAKTCQAKLILLGRTQLPPKAEWSSWLATHEETDSISHKLRKVQHLETLGGEVLVASADVSNFLQMQAIFAQVEAQWGTVHGIIHAAGIVREVSARTISDSDPTSCEPHFQSKIAGLRVLAELLQNREPDWILLFSSLSSIVGGPGGVAEAAANTFMDAFVNQRHSQETEFLEKTRFQPRWISVNWDDLEFDEPPIDQAKLGAQLRSLAISPQEFLEVWPRVVAYGSAESRLIVSTTPLQTRLDQGMEFEAPTRPPASQDVKTSHSRPNLTTRYVQARDAVETRLVGIWENLLGTSPIGIYDNFFELGGHSLLAVRLMAQIEQQFKKRLQLTELFQEATIEQQARWLHQHSQEEEAWSALVPIQTKGSQPPFFGIAGLGGLVLCFSELAHHLGLNQPFYGLQPRGLDGDSSPHATVEEMATYYIETMRTVQPHGPYRIGGHSFGGWVAYEMAQQLRKQGEEVALLAILDAPAPHPVKPPSTPDEWDEAVWLTQLLKIMGHLYNTSLPVTEEALRELPPEAQLRYVHDQLKQAQILPNEASNKLFRGIVEVYAANVRTHYYPKEVVPIPITLFRAREIQSEQLAAGVVQNWNLLLGSAYGWGEFGEVTVEEVPGDHLTMLNAPQVEELAERLMIHLRYSS